MCIKMNELDEKRIQNQFSSFCIKVLKNEIKRIKNNERKLNKYERSIEALNAYEISSLKFYANHYTFRIQINNIEIKINNYILGEAISKLDVNKREIILFFYFLGFNDREIALMLDSLKNTITKKRNLTLKELREILKEYERSDLYL